MVTEELDLKHGRRRQVFNVKKRNKVNRKIMAVVKNLVMAVILISETGEISKLLVR